MSKKRKVWWIVGGIFSLVLLFYVTALLMIWNSTDARLERVLQNIIKEQNLDYNSESDDSAWQDYTGKPISSDKKILVINQLRNACPDCTVSEERGRLGSEFDALFWTPSEGSSISQIMIIFDDKGERSSDKLSHSELSILPNLDHTPWSFIKNLWPW